VTNAVAVALARAPELIAGLCLTVGGAMPQQVISRGLDGRGSSRRIEPTTGVTDAATQRHGRLRPLAQPPPGAGSSC
jgi:hypothetical protein